MTAWDLLRAMNQIPDDWIEEALAPKRQSRRRAITVSVAGLAACAAMALIVWRPWTLAPPAAPAVSAGEENNRPDAAQDAITAAPAQDGAESGAEEYVEGASSVGGDVYTVEGYDESFRLCLADENGTFSLYDCLGGVTLKTGADLFETRLHLESRWESVSFLPDEAWQNNHTDYRPLALTDDEIEAFLSLLMAAPMQDWSAGSENGDIFDQDFAQAHLRFTLTDGTSVSLRLFENGCVTYDGSPARVYACLPGDIFDTVFTACQA